MNKVLVKSIAKQLLSYIPYQYVNVGKEFYTWLDRFQQMRTMTNEQLKDLQLKAFQEKVAFVYMHTPFYQKLYQEHGFHPEKFKDWTDVSRIPVINKNMVREAGVSILPRPFPMNNLIVGATSGTTGTSLTLYTNRKVLQREWAATCFLWSEVGYQPGDGRVEFRGLFTEDRAYQLDRYHRILRINVAKLTVDNIDKIFEVIQKTGYKFFHGYPSALSLVARLIQERKLEFRYQPGAILLASETLHAYQEAVIRNVFPQTKIHVHYGQSEKVIMAGRVEDAPYRFIPLYGYAECNSNTHALIGTSFINDVMPLIRYEIADTVTDFSESPDAGESYLFPSAANIDGRVSEIMYKPNGDMVSSALMAITVRGLNSVTACKFIQRQYDEIEVFLESSLPQHTVMKEMEGLSRNLQMIFTESMKLTFSIVDHIPRTASGKLKFIEVLIGKERNPT
ncbi:hypothetical protein BVG16_25520 [Paenibacillus selenitireducens]|uniref:CoF synthetase n=1 Tax=Paenibacillus selenitireducens TaxID=1324314 RepID=A0A1T2X2M7_9BACL|nr:hypothetical protein [Paenibacillus selenitireducens]OPA74112.1 hypothetical protein BVG16_25520 [Paenibacillus selenitireducens]